MTRYASGGEIRPAGSRDDDRIPAFLSPGWYDVPAATVEAYGEDLLGRLNKRRDPAAEETR